MADKTLKVNLQFNTDVKQAKQQIKSLQQTLTDAINAGSNSALNITPQIQQAQQSAMQLKIALQSATNVNTGKLNLNKFQVALKQSGMSLQQYATQLKMLGPEGVKAFGKMTQAIASADTSLFSLSGGMKKLTESFVNTARWQLASTAIHGVMSAVKGTINYVKDLDSSLNNIRIVTGKSQDSMARFAKEANSAAKALSTTTNEYAKASLIYYQQGLNDKEVKERTDVTMKMANVSRQSAQEVSDQMTAVWNNFDDGTRSLESYSDVMVKLGAETASSSSEIANGMEKFAAISNTVGLSFNNAAAALATVTAKTRQSADVVGTAFKTLFARIEQLKLGETLDDGTTLGQYSQALAKVGVDIKDANGELKDMDIILDETGQRWQTLNRDQQVALAQSVAGIRQYQQFMALMENYDFYQENIERAKDATGALNEQNEIYSSSVEAAEKRMQASGEALKSTVLSANNLKPLYEFGDKALGFINHLLKATGGLKTIILGIATALINTYQPQIATFFDSVGLKVGQIGKALKHPIDSLKSWTSGNGFTGNVKGQFQQEATDTYANMLSSENGANEGSNKILYERIGLEKEYAAIKQSLTPQEQQLYEWQLKLLEAEEEKVRKLEEEINLQGKLAQEKQDEFTKNSKFFTKENMEKVDVTGRTLGAAKGHSERALSMATELQEQSKTGAPMDKTMSADYSNELSKSLDLVEQKIEMAGSSTKEFKEKMEEARSSLVEFSNGGKNIDEVKTKIEELNTIVQKTENRFDPAKILGETSKNLNNLNNSNMPNEIKNKDDVQQVTEIANGIDTSLLKADSDQSKTAIKDIKNIQKLTTENKNLDKTIAQLEQQKRKLNKETENGTKANKKEKDELQKIDKKLESARKKRTGYHKELKKSAKSLKENSSALKEDNKLIADATNKKGQFTKAANDEVKAAQQVEQASEQQGQKYAELEKFITSLLEKMGLLNNNMKGSGPQTFGQKLTGLLGPMSSMLMASNMLSGAVETLQGLFANGWDTKDFMSAMSSILMSCLMLIPTFGKLYNGFIKVGLGKRKGADMSKAADEEEIKSNTKKMGSNAAEAGTNIGKEFSKGPFNWPAAIATAATVAAIFAPLGFQVVSSFGSAPSEAETEKANEEADKGLENIEAIKENKELSESVDKVTEKYKKLKENGESTADVLSEMNDKIPELIDSYKELAKTLGTDIDTSSLEEAYKNFQATGDLTAFNQEKEAIDNEIEDKEKKNAKNTVRNATTAVYGAAEGSDIDTDGSGKDFSFDFDDTGDASNEAETALHEALGDAWDEAWDGDDFNINMDSEADILEKYDLMGKALEELEEQGKTDNSLYRDMKQAYNDMTESVEKLRAAVSEQQQLKIDDLLESGEAEEEIAKKFSFDENTTQVDYEKKRKELINYLKTQYRFTDEMAELYLKQSKNYGKYEKTMDAFKEGKDGEKDSVRVQQIKQNQNLNLNTIKEWYNGLSEEDKTLALSIDFTLPKNLGEVQDALAEIRTKANISKDIGEATAVDSSITDDQVKAYAESLNSLTEGFKGNKEAATQAAAVNIKFQKGMESAAKVWKDSVEIIKKGNKASFEYGEALGKLKTELQKAFGVELSNDFIENKENMEELDKVMNGDLSTMDKLQKAAAQDYVAHMDLKVFENGDHSLEEIQGWRKQIEEEISKIDTSIALGENVTVSDTFLENLQNMLDAGAMTEDQLKNIFNSMGIAATYTYSNKMIDGPDEVTEEWTTDENGNDKGIEHVYKHKKTKVSVPQLFVNGKPSTQLKTTKASSPSTISGSSIAKASGSSSDSSKEDKSLDKESERYHVINKQIDSTTKAYERLSKAKDKAYGKDKLKLIDQMIAKNDELIAQEQEKARQIEANLSKDAGLMKGYGAQFDESGNITNYDQLMAEQVAKYNGSKSDEAEKAYTAFTDALKQYEDTLNEYQDIQDTIAEKTYQALDLKLEKIDYEVQLKIDIDDRDLEYIEYMIKMIEDDSYNAAESIALLSKQTAANLDKMEAYQKGIEDILATSGASQAQIQDFLTNGNAKVLAGLTISEEQIEKLKDYSKNLLDLNLDLKEIAKTMHEELIESFEEGNEEFEQASGKIEHLTQVTQNYKDITDLINKDRFGIDTSFIKELNDTLVQTAKNAVTVAKAKVDTQKEELAAAREALAQAETEETRKYWEDTVNQIYEEVMSAEEEFQDAWKEGLQTAADAFENNVETIVEALKKSLGGIYESLDAVKEQFDQQKTISESYLKDYQKMYETNKLIRTINKSIDSTDNLKAQRQLARLSKEIAEYQKDGKKMSDYDLQYLQKKYDLLLAQQALEDAKNAKDTVRLQRDSQGNYGYVYTANQDKIADAQQKVDDLQYAIDNLNYETLETAQDNYLQHTQEWIEAKAELNEQDFANHDDYLKKLAEIDNYYQELLNADFYNIQQVVQNTGQQYQDTLLGQMYPDYDNFKDLHAGITDEVEGVNNDLVYNFITWESDISNLLTAAGTSEDDFKEKVEEDMDKVREESEETAKSTEEMKTRIVNAFEEAANKVISWEQTYAQYIDAAIDKNEDMFDSISDLMEQYSNLITEAENTTKRIVDEANKQIAAINSVKEAQGLEDTLGLGDTLRLGDTLGLGDISSYNPSLEQQYDDFGIASGSGYNAYTGKPTSNIKGTAKHMQLTNHKAESNGAWFGTGYTKAGLKDQIKSGDLSSCTTSDGKKYIFKQIGEKIYVKSASSDYYYLIDELEFQLGYGSRIYAGQKAYSYFAKGGLVNYTGPAWVDGTPSAPEAFLNPEQTQLIGTLAAALTANTNVASQGLNLSTFGLIPNYNQQPIQQDVTIHAEFPNATDHSEIEEAFNTLVNRASQYINRE